MNELTGQVKTAQLSGEIKTGSTTDFSVFATQAWVLEQINAAINDTWEASY